MKRRRRSPEPPALQETEYGAMFERLSSDAGLKVETLFHEVDDAASLLAEKPSRNFSKPPEVFWKASERI